MTAATGKQGRSVQAVLPFSERVSGPMPYRPGAAQREAQRQLALYAQRLTAAPSGLTTIIVTGPEGAGKTRMMDEWLACEPDLDAVPLAVGELGPMEVFAEINSAAAARGVLLLEARQGPERWFAGRDAEAPPDLFSRLLAVPRVSLDRPSPEALAEALRADLALHDLVLSDRDIEAVCDRLPRRYDAVRLFCRALDGAGPVPGRRALLQLATERCHVRSDGSHQESH